MTKTAHAKIGSNSKQKFEQFDATITEILKITTEAEAANKGYHAHVHSALVQTYGLGVSMIQSDLLDLYLGAKLKKVSAKQDQNPFHELVGLLFPEAKADSQSKYRRVLKYALDEGWSDQQLQKELSKETYAGLYQRALSANKSKGDTRVEDDTREKLAEAKAVLATTSLGSIADLNEDAMEGAMADGYANAVIRKTETGAEIVGFVPVEETADFERNLIQLVPGIAQRKTLKLSKKRLYEFFVICDVFVRIQPSQKEIVQQMQAYTTAKKVLKLDRDATEDETAEVISIGKPKSFSINDYVKPKQMLWLSWAQGGNVIEVENGCLLPSMVAMRAKLDWKKFKQQAPMLSIPAPKAKAFQSDFMRQLDWVEEHTSQITHITAEAADSATHAFVGKTKSDDDYRVYKPGANEILQFNVTKGILSELSRWREEFGRQLHKRSQNTFPSMLNLSEEEGFLWVSCPKRPTTKRKLGKLDESQTGIPQLDSTWLIDTRQLERVVDVAIGYGLTYEGKLLAMAGAPFGIELATELPSGTCTLTLPLNVGLAGGFVENTQAVAITPPKVASRN